ncbi:glycoside hydrolase family 43 protein [Sphingomonas sp. I4]
MVAWRAQDGGRGGNTALVGVHAYSSTDLVDWRDEGIALPVSDDPASPIARGCILERPKVVYNRRTRQFVMWFHLELKGRGYGAAQAGVAVADRPQGPFRFLRAGRVNPGIWPANATPEDKAPGTTLARDFPGGQMARDMTVFVDGDTAWHVYASEENATLQIARLAPDWTTHDGYYVRALPDGGNEAPAIFKAKGRYYMFASGLTGWRPNPGRVYVADRVTGPWRSLGNPVRGSEQDAKTTFHSQSTFVLPLPPERPGASRASSSWRTGGGPRMRSTDAMSGCRWSGRARHRSCAGGIAGRWRTGGAANSMTSTPSGGGQA